MAGSVPDWKTRLASKETMMMRTGYQPARDAFKSDGGRNWRDFGMGCLSGGNGDNALPTDGRVANAISIAYNIPGFAVSYYVSQFTVRIANKNGPAPSCCDAVILTGND
jgi:hypothetical protein